MAHYHDDAPLKELEELRLVEMFGAVAVYGGQMPVTKLRSLRMMSVLMNAWDARQASENWSEWADKNQGANNLLMWAEGLTDGE